jgi:N-acyl-D-aspartate/D-glutamate deacylase
VRSIVFKLATMMVLLATVSQAQARYDVVVRGGQVIDGTGAPRVRADLGIRGGRIVAVGDLAAARGATEIDATGRFVVPGFVNLHSHASAAALPVAMNMLTQGVTTELLNADGGGPIDLATQLTPIEAGGLAVNVAASIGFNAVWQNVMGPSNRRPSPEEITRMRGLIVAGLQQGAYGVSGGLDYKPAYFATTDEVVQILEPARPWRTFFPNHDRSTPESGYSSRAGVEETRLIGERTGLVPQFTHMKIQGHEQGTASAVIEMMTAASAAGRWVAADVYPYLSGQTSLAALIIPGWAQDGGLEALRGRLRDSTQRAKIITESDQAIKARFNGPESIMVLGTRRLSDIMRETGSPTAGAAVAKVLETESPWAILGFGIEADLVKIMQYHSAAIACDCGAATGSRGHPRYYGTFPRVLGRYVREQRVTSWEDAIRKMSGLPAAMMGLVDRGLLAPGMVADVVVFDSATVIDRATFEQPDLVSEGIRHVLVNGRVALKDGKVTGERGGVVLRRAAATPSRPMDLATARRAAAGGAIIVFGDSSRATLRVDLRQNAGARRAAGRVTITHPGRSLTIRSTDLGVLQAGHGWASITGLAQVSGVAEPRPFTLTLEEAAPLLDGSPSTVRLVVEGIDPIEGRLLEPARVQGPGVATGSARP